MTTAQALEQARALCPNAAMMGVNLHLDGQCGLCRNFATALMRAYADGIAQTKKWDVSYWMDWTEQVLQRIRAEADKLERGKTEKT